jgi:hypothetical protein
LRDEEYLIGEDENMKTRNIKEEKEIKTIRL